MEPSHTRSSVFTAYYTCRNAEMYLKSTTTSGFNIHYNKFINVILEIMLGRWLYYSWLKLTQTNTCLLNVLLQATPAVVISGIPEMHVGKSTVPHRQAPHLQLIWQKNHAPERKKNNYKLIQMNLFHLWRWLAFWKYQVKSHSEHWNHKVLRKLFFFTHSSVASLAN